MRRLVAIVPMLLAGAAAAQSTETIVQIPSQGQMLTGTLEMPAGATDDTPVVLLFHGFTGSRDELGIPGTDEGVFSRTARLLAAAGYASLRIDFIGSGESPGDFADTTFEGQIADGLAAAQWLDQQEALEDDIFIIGWSQGGLVAAAVAGRLDAMDEEPEAVALWAAVAQPLETFSGILGAEMVGAGQAAGAEPVVGTLPWGAEVALKRPFFDGLSTLDPLAEIAAYDGPLFVAHGTADPTVPYAAQQMFLDAHNGVEEAYTRDMDHAFNVFADVAVLDEMVGATIAFFDAQDD